MYYSSTRYYKLHPSVLPKFTAAVISKINKHIDSYADYGINENIETLTVEKKIIGDYNKAYNNYMLDNTIQNFMVLNGERDRLLNFLDNVADFVNSIAGGNPEIIKIFGFYPKKLKEKYAL